MNLRKALTPDTIRLNLAGKDKTAIITEMVDVLVASSLVKDREGALKAVFERERKMSTGMQYGIAIPHAKCDSVETLVAAIGVVKDGVDFDALDGQPARIIILTLSPAKRAGPHIQFLAEISRLLSNETTRERVLTAATPDALLGILSA